MRPRPIQRWKSLWLGVLVVCFLAWAWRDSMSFSSWAAFRSIRVGNASGAIDINYVSLTPVGAPFEWGRFNLATTYDYVKFEAFVSPLLLRGEGRKKDPSLLGQSVGPISYHRGLKNGFLFRPREDWQFFIPHWLVMLAFMVPWAGFLGWRWRWVRRLSNSGVAVAVPS